MAHDVQDARVPRQDREADLDNAEGVGAEGRRPESTTWMCESGPGEMGLRPVLGGFLAALVTPTGRAACVQIGVADLSRVGAIDAQSPAVEIISRSTGFEASHFNSSCVFGFRGLLAAPVP